MKTKTILAALALAVAPSLAFAACSGFKHEDVAMSCAPGSVWDAESRSCVPTTG